jgi:hypothetical protein
MPWPRQATLGCLWLGVLLVAAIKLPQDEPIVNPEVCIRQANGARQEVTALLAVMVGNHIPGTQMLTHR